MSEWDIKEAKRFAAFELGEQTRVADGTWNRFVDGVFFERVDQKLPTEFRGPAFRCGKVQFEGKCLKPR